MKTEDEIKKKIGEVYASGWENERAFVWIDALYWVLDYSVNGMCLVRENKQEGQEESPDLGGD